MATPDRRRVDRHQVDLPGELFLSEGRCIPVRILNLGQLGALVSMTDLEEAVLEGERVLLGHPVLDEGAPTLETARTSGALLRVELDFAEAGVSRHLAIYFDGGPEPEGCAA